MLGKKVPLPRVLSLGSSPIRGDILEIKFSLYIREGLKKNWKKSGQADRFGPCHPLTWTQRKSHRFGQGAHVRGAKIEQDPAELVLTFKTWALYSELA